MYKICQNKAKISQYQISNYYSATLLTEPDLALRLISVQPVCRYRYTIICNSITTILTFTTIPVTDGGKEGEESRGPSRHMTSRYVALRHEAPVT